MSVKIVSKDGNVVITADDGSSVSGITVNDEEIIGPKPKYKCDCLGCKYIILALLVATIAATGTALMMILESL